MYCRAHGQYEGEDCPSCIADRRHMGLSKGEKARFGDGDKDPEGVLYDIPVNFTIAAMDKETAKRGAEALVEVFKIYLEEGRQQQAFDNVLWEPIELKVADG